jgi:hypothetical protein
MVTFSPSSNEEKKSEKKTEEEENWKQINHGKRQVKRQMEIDGNRCEFTSIQFMEVYHRLKKDLCLNNMSPSSSPQRDPKAAAAAELCATDSPCAQAVPLTSIVDSPLQALRKRSMNLQGLISSNEPVGIEQEQVKSTPLSGKKRMKFMKEEDDAIRDRVKKFGEGDWKSIKTTCHAKVLNRRDNVGGVALSDIPTRYATPKYQPSVIHVSPKVSRSKRNKFTEAENDAIRKGVEKFGAGNWAQIKSASEFAMVLRNRSSVNIKDRWRNMNK